MKTTKNNQGNHISDEYAKNAYLYGYSSDEAYKYLYNTTISKNIPLNEFQLMRELAGASYHEHPSINNDTIHVMGWLDVADEPMVVTVPDFDEGRYWVLQTMDMGHYTNGLIGSRTRGTKGGTFMFVAERYAGSIPPGIDQVVRSYSDIVKIMGRIMAIPDIPGDMKKAQELQDKWKLQTANQFLGHKPLPPMRRKYPDPDDTNWVERVNFILANGTISKPDHKWLAASQDIGLQAGKTDFTAEQLDAMKRGEKLGMARIVELAPKVKDGRKCLGTREQLEDGPRDYFCEGTYIGQWGAPVEEAMYFNMREGSDGKFLNGSNGKTYRIHMEAPKIHSFWSLTVYRSSDLFMCENPLNRYSRGDRTLKANKDGSYTIELGADCTGQEKNPNFLPIPEDDFYLLLRLYGPTETIIEGNYKVPVVEVEKIEA